PVVDSPRQLWSVAAYFDLVTQGVFGLTDTGKVRPKSPVSLIPMLFGTRRSISLHLRPRDITLRLASGFVAAYIDANVLHACHASTHGSATTVTLKAVRVDAPPLRTGAPLHAPSAPPAPVVTVRGDHWKVEVDGKVRLYVDGRPDGT